MASRTVNTSQRGVNRILNQLNRSIESENYYEAHQLYRTLHFRYIAQRKYNECADLLYNGALKLIANAQECSGADLGLLILDVLEKCEQLDHEEWWDRLSFLIECLDPSVAERENLIHRIIKWSGEVTSNKYGAPILHQRIGSLFWDENNMEQARHHLFYGEDGILFGRFLVKMSRRCYKNEIDLLIAQATLQLLAMKDTVTAEETFYTYVHLHPDIQQSEPPFRKPLLNFLFYLIQSIHKNLTDTFRTICHIYKSSLDRDEAYHKYIQKIGQIYFNVTLCDRNANNSTATSNAENSQRNGNNTNNVNQSQQRQGTTQNTDFMGGMFGNLFSRLLQGFGDSISIEVDDVGDGDSSDVEFEDAIESNTFNEFD